eukprot:UN33309
MSSDSVRCYKNELPSDKSPDKYETKIKNFKEKWKTIISKSLNKFDHGAIYTGICGVSMMYLHLNENIKNAINIVEQNMEEGISSRRHTFVEGKPGAYALLAVLSANNKDEKTTKKYTDKVLKWHKKVKK